MPLGLSRDRAMAEGYFNKMNNRLELPFEDTFWGESSCETRRETCTGCQQPSKCVD